MRGQQVLHLGAWRGELPQGCRRFGVGAHGCWRLALDLGGFTVDPFERDMLIYYMDSETVGEVSTDNFLANPSAYYNDGSSSMLSRTHFKDMAQIVGGW